jgi:hypothetical protein
MYRDIYIAFGLRNEFRATEDSPIFAEIEKKYN